MNADTGQRYFNQEDVDVARLRGERLVELDRQNIDRAIRQACTENETKCGPVVPMSRGKFRRAMRGLK